MPIHDWTRVNAGLFHHFHQAWAAELSNQLNAGQLPAGYFALLEQVASGPIPDVLTLQSKRRSPQDRGGGVAVATHPPKAAYFVEAEDEQYAARADRIAIRHPLGHVVAIIEIVSPGNKGSRTALRSFVENSVDFLRQGVNLLIIDLFPPSIRDPQGIHKALWDEVREEPFEPPPDKPLTIAAYKAGPPKSAYVDPVAVGDPLPDMPIFLDAATYIPAPLEASYEATWRRCPPPFRDAVSGID